MKKLQDINPNTNFYWNNRYTGTENRIAYEKETGTSRFLRTMDEIKDGDRVLDIGCGIGQFTTLVKGMFPNCEVWGTDISGEVIDQNKRENSSIKYFQQIVGNQTELPNDYFDLVFSGEVLEHLDEPSDLFRDAHRVLKTGGKFVITTPSGSHIQSPEHMYEFEHEDIEKLYKENGFGRHQFIYLPNQEHLLVIMAVGKKI